MKKKTGRFVDAQTNKKEKHQAKDRKGKDTAELKKPDAKYQNKALTKQESIIKKYGSMDAYFDAAPVICKVKKEGSLFITAEGLALPCCWTAGRMYKWWHQDYRVEQIWDFIDRAGGKQGIDVINNDLETVMHNGLLQDIQNSWSKPSIADGKLGVCAMKCGEDFDPFGAQFV